MRRRLRWAARAPIRSAQPQRCHSVTASRGIRQCCFDATIDTLGTEPRASRVLSGCDTTTPCAQLIAQSRLTRPLRSELHCQEGRAHNRAADGARAPLMWMGERWHRRWSRKVWSIIAAGPEAHSRARQEALRAREPSKRWRYTTGNSINADRALHICRQTGAWG